MGLENKSLAYVFHAYNRPHLFAPSLLSIRNQLINSSRPIYLILDGPANESDQEKVIANKLIFNAFLDGYKNKHIIEHPTNIGAELMFANTFVRLFEEYSVDCFALFEDDLYFESCYVHNVEKLLDFTYDDLDVAAVSGFTRHTIFKNKYELLENKRKVVAQHNLIGSYFKRSGWDILKPIFHDYIDLTFLKFPDNFILSSLNEKYGLSMPHIAYDKIVHEAFTKHKKLRISTYNRYLYHLGIFGTSGLKKINSDTSVVLSNFIKYNWNNLSTDSNEIDYFIFDKLDPSFFEQTRTEHTITIQ